MASHSAVAALSGGASFVGAAEVPKYSTLSTLFNGSNQYVNMGNVLNFERTDAFSISAWFKDTSVSGNSMIVSKQVSGPPNTGYAIQMRSDTGKIRVYLISNYSGNNYIQVETTTVLKHEGRWRHILVTYDGSGKASGVVIYINGVAEAPSNVINSLSGSILTTSPFNIGSRSGAAADCWKGNIDEVAIWDRALSYIEAASVYNLGRPGNLDTHSAESNLVGWWRMGEDASFPVVPDRGHGSNVIHDFSEGGLDGIAVNMNSSNSVSDAPYGKCVVFDGSNDYVTMGNVLNFERTDAFSISGWFKTDRSANQTFFSKISAPKFDGYQLLGWGDTFAFSLWNIWSSGVKNGLEIRVSKKFNDNMWHHLVAIYDGSSTPDGMAIFLDGVKLLSVTVEYDSLSGSILNSNEFCLGIRFLTSDKYPFSGLMSEVSVWSKALSESEVAEIHNNGTQPIDLLQTSMASDLAAWWPMGSGDTYPTLQDKSGNSLHGTMTNMSAASIQDRAVPATAFLKKSLLFDGSSTKYINCGNILAYERTDHFSISVWFKNNATTDLMILGKIGDNFRGYALSTKNGFVRVEIISTYPNDWIYAITQTTTWSDNRWHHVVMTYDGSSHTSGISIYIDGNIQPVNTGGALTGTITTSADLHIGQRSYAGQYGLFPFIGNIGSMAFYGKALNSAEVEEIYNHGYPMDLLSLASVADLDAWWRFDEYLPNHGTMVNMAASNVVQDTTWAYHHKASAALLGVSSLSAVTAGLKYSVESMAFDGISQYVTMGNAMEFERTDSFTLALWFKAASEGGVLAGKTAAFPQMRGWRVSLVSGRIQVSMCSHEGAGVFLRVSTVSDDWNDGVWHFLAVVYDGSSQADGVRIQIGEEEQALSVERDFLVGDISNDAEFMLAARMDSGVADAYEGQLDEVSVWSRVLSPAEVEEIGNSGRPTNLAYHSAAENLVGWWRMGEGVKRLTVPTLGTGSAKPYFTVADLAGSHRGTMVSMSSADVVEDSPSLYSLKSGKCLAFSGSKRVDYGKFFGFDWDVPFTFSLWMKFTTGGNTHPFAKIYGPGGYYGYQCDTYNGKITFAMQVSGTYGINTHASPLINDGMWHHVVHAYDGSKYASGVTWYIDGNEVTHHVAFDNNKHQSMQNDNATFHLATRQDGHGYFPGSLDEFAIWNKKLTASEVAEIYKGGQIHDLTKVSCSGNLICWYPFDDDVLPGAVKDCRHGSGVSDVYPNVLDSSGNEYHGVMTNMGKEDILLDSPRSSRGKCVVFDGSDEYVTMGNVLNFERTDSFSISGWVRTAATSNGTILGKVTNNVFNAGYDLIVDSSGKPYCDICSNFSSNDYLQVGASSVSVNNNQWHHVVMTYDGSSSASGVSIYIDGKNALLTVYKDSLSGSATSSSQLTIGGRIHSTPYPFNGKISEVSVWNKALSESEAIEIYNEGMFQADLLQTSMASDLAAWWPMGSGDTYPTLQDKSGNSLHGTMTNMSAASIQPVEFIPATFNKFSARFNGSNKYIKMGNVLGFDVTDKFSVGAWVKDVGTGGYIVSKANTTVVGWGLTGRDNSFEFRLLNGGSTQVYKKSLININDGLWHFVLATYDGTSKAAGISLYLDGEKDNSAVATYDSLTGNILNTSNLNIGSRSDGQAAFLGKISDVSVWDKELSASEVAEVYNSGLPMNNKLLSSAGSLVGYWRLGDLIRFDGASSGMVAGDVQDRLAFNPDAYSKHSLTFGGSRYVNAGGIFDFERTDTFSFSIWFKATTTNENNVFGKVDSDFKGYYLKIRANDIYFSFNSSPSSTNYMAVSNPTKVNDSRWHHAMIVYDGSGKASGLSICLNGTNWSKTVARDTLTGSTLNSEQFIMGTRLVDMQSFVGRLNELACWNRVLSASEVEDVYSQGMQGDLLKLSSAESLLAYWRLGETLPANGYMVGGSVVPNAPWVASVRAALGADAALDASLRQHFMALLLESAGLSEGFGTAQTYLVACAQGGASDLRAEAGRGKGVRATLSGGSAFTVTVFPEVYAKPMVGVSHFTAEAMSVTYVGSALSGGSDFSSTAALTVALLSDLAGGTALLAAVTADLSAGAWVEGHGLLEAVLSRARSGVDDDTSLVRAASRQELARPIRFYVVKDKRHR